MPINKLRIIAVIAILAFIGFVSNIHALTVQYNFGGKRHTPTPTTTATPTPVPLALIGTPLTVNQATTANLTIAYPAGTSASSGQQVAWVYLQGTAGNTVTGVRNWTLSKASPSLSGYGTYLLFRVIDATDVAVGSETFHISAGNLATAVIAVYDGVNVAVPEDTAVANPTSNNGNGATVTFPGFTTLQSGDQLAAFVAFVGSTSTVSVATTPTGFGNPVQNFDPTTRHQGISFWDKAQGPAGAITSPTSTVTGTDAGYLAMLIAIQPAIGGSTPTPTPSVTPTPTSTPTGTSTPSPTATPTPSPTPSATPTPPPGTITATNCPTNGLVTPTGSHFYTSGALCTVDGGPVPCPTSSNWINPMNHSGGSASCTGCTAVGDGVADDTAALQAANNAGDVCIPSGKTFLMKGQVNVTNAKKWQAGMIGGAAPIIKINKELNTVAGVNHIHLAGNGPTSVIGLDFEDSNTSLPRFAGPLNAAAGEYNFPIVGQSAKNVLIAGNYFHNYWAQGGIEFHGNIAGACEDLISAEVEYNKFEECGLYGVVGTDVNHINAHENVTIDGAEGMENNNTACSPTDLFNHETNSDVHGAHASVAGSYTKFNCDVTYFTGGAASSSNYVGVTMSNSWITGASPTGNICVWPTGSAGHATYTGNFCGNGCLTQ